MPMVTGAFSHLLAPGIRKVFFGHLKERKPEFEQIFTTVKSTRNYEEHLEMAGLGTMPTKPEGNSVIYQDFLQGGLKRFTHVTYGLGIRISEEMMEDDLYGPMKRSARALKRSALNAKEVAAWGVLNGAFTTEFGFPKNGVNQSIINSAHTLLGGGTASNTAGAVDISFGALEAATIHFNTLNDERGMPIDFAPEFLVHHPNDAFLVTQLLDSAYRPFTANNEVNPLKGVLKPIWSRYLTDADAWFVIGGKDEEGLVHFSRRPLRLQNGDDFDSGDAKFKATWRGSFGISEWRYIYGGAGV